MEPIDIDEFNAAFNFAMNAGIGQAEVEDPRKLCWSVLALITNMQVQSVEFGQCWETSKGAPI
jgi:hypothetical protein